MMDYKNKNDPLKEKILDIHIDSGKCEIIPICTDLQVALKAINPDFVHNFKNLGTLAGF